jgi:hypothetical protein
MPWRPPRGRLVSGRRRANRQLRTHVLNPNKAVLGSVHVLNVLLGSPVVFPTCPVEQEPVAVRLIDRKGHGEAESAVFSPRHAVLILGPAVEVTAQSDRLRLYLGRKFEGDPAGSMALSVGFLRHDLQDTAPRSPELADELDSVTGGPQVGDDGISMLGIAGLEGDQNLHLVDPERQAGTVMFDIEHVEGPYRQL